MKKIRRKFLKKVRKIPGGCWIWTGSIHKSGYGYFCFNGVSTVASRVSFILYRGKIPKGLFVCHKCDIRECVKPGHLFVGTQTDNLQDAKRKGRLGGPQRQHRKLTFKQAEQIREIHGSNGNTFRSLGKKYGVGKTSIEQILNFESYRCP